MPSQTDLDMGGTNRQWMRQYMGPSVGWVTVPYRNVQKITVAGTYTIDPSINLVKVNCAGAVIILLPTAIDPTVPAGVQAALFAHPNISIFDDGGNGFAHPITIKPASVAETILGLTQIQITSNYGGFTLASDPGLPGWTNPQ